MSTFVQKCKKHGNLTIDEVYSRPYKQTIYYKCKKCILSLNIKRKYEGMNSLDDYERMLLKQRGVCGLCKGKNNSTRNGKIKRFSIDHDHKTGKVRKLLCNFCNSMLGYARDNPLLLSDAIIYLTRENETLLYESINKLQTRTKSLMYIHKRLKNKKEKARN